MGTPLLLEVCAYNIQSCIIAEKTGAARIELCADPLQGGTTPSYGIIQRVKEKISIALYPIIRPRGGDFLYDEDEFAIIKNDIAVCKQLGCEGISTGIQLQDGSIDVGRMKKIVEWAYPMRVTCHRVFDITPNPFKALDALIDCGCERVLTSGQKKAAFDGSALLAELVTLAGNRIVIMPGGRVRSTNIRQLATQTGAVEFHSSALPAKDNAVNGPLSAGNKYIIDEAELRAIISRMKNV